MIRSVHIHKPERLDTGYNCIYIGEIGKMSDVQLEILDAEGFEWDENKSKANSLKHASASSRRAARGNMKKEHIVTRKWGDRRKGKTDWARVDALTDEDIEAAIANDPDWEEFKDVDWSDAVLVIPPRKKAISIRVDEDVLDFFKREGEGYQRRMNAVLRSYMQQKSKPRKRA
jgi:uncharacterized protein (DUF4415 family)